MKNLFLALQSQLEGSLYFQDGGFDNAMRMVYATDASVYQEKPIAVALPSSKEDIRKLIQFATDNRLSLVPRAAGTSLAGQAVGNGIVVDLSVGWDKVIEINVREKWVKVQPGIIRDDLNKYLQQFGLMYGPETSTANRAMIGGMVGNNSCGLHSIRWGSARDHLLEAIVLLSDGSEATFQDITLAELNKKIATNDNLESNILKGIIDLLNDEGNKRIIENSFPKKNVVRRNTGYALDSLLYSGAFSDKHPAINFCKLLAGSEGTLCFFTQFKLRLIECPPVNNVLLCVHFAAIRECLDANVIAMQHNPYASELVDKRILDFTKDHPVFNANRFFIDGDPEAILMIEFFSDRFMDAESQAKKLITDLKSRNLGYAYPILTAEEMNHAWDIRKAGLGLLRNMPGNIQPVNLIEDCAVSIEDLPDYVDDIAILLKKHNLTASYYAHAGAGELHIEPMINLKRPEGIRLFRLVLSETVKIIKKYNGSLSGEHGDGRLRGEFIPSLMGEEAYQLFKKVKHIFDPVHVFNAGKIVDTPPMDTQLRYNTVTNAPATDTIFNFSKDGGLLSLTERCSGSGDCRKTHLSGGTMCPSYMATRQERDTTRARANILRQFLSNSEKPNPFDHEEIKGIMDLCLSCKGCKTECPSAVDVSKMKAEFLQHYYKANGVPFKTKMIGNFTRINELASLAPGLYNFFLKNRVASGVIRNMLGFAPERSLPFLNEQTLRNWFKKWEKKNAWNNRKKKVLLFADEFTNYTDLEIGKKAVLLLAALGYGVQIPNHLESGRTYLSKGLLFKAQKIAVRNVELLWPFMKDGVPLIGLEPSAILSFRDEYLDLVPDSLLEKAKYLAKNSFYIDEFIAAEIDYNDISRDQFTQIKRVINLHGHCHQKALSHLSATVKMLSIPSNYSVEIIPSGCCGMAGSFGYEKEHYNISIKIGELILFPAVRAADKDVIIAAPGTSCRHQIKDGTGRQALHPVEILWEALDKN
jgi:FAD/FMN-containing dehydrogenase/Fe-S oxidoreductase